MNSRLLAAHLAYGRSRMANSFAKPLAILRDGDHEDDPTIVQLAVQAWEGWCCRQVLDAFCAGAPPEVDRFLHDIFHEMQSSGGNLFLSIVLVASHVDPLKYTYQNRKRRLPVGGP